MVPAWPPRPPRHPARRRARRDRRPRARAGVAASRHRSTSCRPGATSCRSWIRRSPRRSRPGLEALLGGLEPGPAAGGHARRRPAAGRRRRRDRQDPGHHAAGSPGSIATRRARPSEILALTFTDKAAEEMAVRVDQLVPYGYTDTAISTFHAFGDRLIREYALELGLPTDVRVLTAAGGRDLPARAPLRVRARRLPAARRPDPLPGRARDPVQPLQGRGHRAGRLPRARADGRRGRGGGSRRRPRRSAPRRRRDGRARRPARQAELARAYATYQRLLAANGCIDFGDQVALALRLVRDVGRGPGRDRRPVPVHPRRRVPGHQPRPGRARRRSLAEAHRNVTVVGDDDQAIYAFRGAAIDNILGFRDRYRRGTDRRPAPQLPLARAGPRRRLPPRPVQRPGPARGPRRRSSSGSAPSAARRDAAAGPARGVRDGARGGRLDRRRDRPADRGRAPRRATTPSSSARTATPTRSCARSTWPASRGASRARRACTPGPRSACLLAFLRVDRRPRLERRPATRSRASEVYGLGGEDLTAIVNMARRRQPLGAGRSSRSSTASRGSCALAPGDAADGRTGCVADLRRVRASWRTSGRPASCCTAFLRGERRRWPAWSATDTPRRRGGAPEHRPVLRDRPRASRRCSPTTGRVFVAPPPARRSSRRATTRRPPSSTRTPTRSRS